jgi:hypothetical protein
MSTDALREALQQIIATYDEWVNHPNPEFGSRYLDDAIDKARAALAAPTSETVDNLTLHQQGYERRLELLKERDAGETDKLPAKLEEALDMRSALHLFPTLQFVAYIDKRVAELEAALKADRQGR